MENGWPTEPEPSTKKQRRALRRLLWDRELVEGTIRNMSKIEAWAVLQVLIDRRPQMTDDDEDV